MTGRDFIAQHSIREINLKIGIDVTTAKLLLNEESHFGKKKKFLKKNTV